MTNRNYLLNTGKRTDPLSRAEPTEIYSRGLSRIYAKSLEKRPLIDSHRTTPVGTIMEKVNWEGKEIIANKEAARALIKLYGVDRINRETGEVREPAKVPGEMALLTEIFFGRTRMNEYLATQLEEARRQLVATLTQRAG